jgi:formylglycine-generating enzyme required for sulfatase activity
MRLAPGYLRKKGYRLPTEAEWECACRAGARTRRHYGDADGLLKEYAWYFGNTGGEGARPGGRLKPNDLGLFDLYGNALEWAQDPALLYRRAANDKDKDDIEYDLDIKDNVGRSMRGGSFTIPASYVRSADRLTNRPSLGVNAAGFRVARTYPTPDPSPKRGGE